MRYKVAAFYKFVRLEDFKDIRKPLLETCRNLELSGTILLASEGINGTVAGSDAGIDALVDYLVKDHRLDVRHGPFRNDGLSGVSPRRSR